MSLRASIAVFLAVIGLVSGAVGQVTDGRYDLANRSRLELRVGAWTKASGTNTEVSIGSVNVSTSAGGAAGGVGFVHFLQENLAVEIAVTGLAVAVDTRVGIGGVETSTASIAAILPGVRYYFPNSTRGTKFRPFLSGGAGLAIGSQSKTEVSSQVVYESTTEIAPAAELGLGADVLLGRHFIVGVHAGHLLMAGFGEPVAGRINYSSPVVSFGFSYVF